jgi:hypothetical protein
MTLELDLHLPLGLHRSRKRKILETSLRKKPRKKKTKKKSLLMRNRLILMIKTMPVVLQRDRNRNFFTKKPVMKMKPALRSNRVIRRNRSNRVIQRNRSNRVIRRR